MMRNCKQGLLFRVTVLSEVRWSKIHYFCLVWMERDTWLIFWISHHQIVNQLRDYALVHDDKCYTEEAHPLFTLILSSVKSAFPDV